MGFDASVQPVHPDDPVLGEVGVYPTEEEYEFDDWPHELRVLVEKEGLGVNLDQKYTRGPLNYGARGRFCITNEIYENKTLKECAEIMRENIKSMDKIFDGALDADYDLIYNNFSTDTWSFMEFNEFQREFLRNVFEKYPENWYYVANR